MARGEDKDLPKPVAWAKGWVHGKPDVVFEMPEEFDVPATGVVSYKYWIVETNFKEDKWVRIAEARPGAAGCCASHRRLRIPTRAARADQPRWRHVRLDRRYRWHPAGRLGSRRSWPGLARRHRPAHAQGSAMLFEMHYTPNGTPVKDRSAIGLTFADKPPRFEILIGECVNIALEVPPHDPHYKSEATFRLRADARILILTPHMHWRGKDFRFEAIYPDGKRQTLFSVPRSTSTGRASIASASR